MAKIIVNRENFKVDEIELEQGTLSVGRHDDNDLCIDDLTVSGHHAQIVTVFGSTYVEDLGSTNGTYVNGKKVKTHTLHNGDVLTIGHYQLLFQGENAVNPHAGSDETRMINQSQVEVLMKKADAKHHQAERAARRPSPAPASTARATAAPHAVAAASSSAQAQQARAPHVAVASKGPSLVSDNRAVQAPQPEVETLPDIEDPSDMIGQHTPPEQSMKPLRRGDVSPSSSLKIIVLAALTAAATFVLMMLFFDL